MGRKVGEVLAKLDFKVNRAAFSMLHVNAIATNEKIDLKDLSPQI